MRIYHTRHPVHSVFPYEEFIDASPPERGARPGAVNWMNGAAWITWYGPDAQPIDPEECGAYIPEYGACELPTGHDGDHAGV